VATAATSSQEDDIFDDKNGSSGESSDESSDEGEAVLVSPMKRKPSRPSGGSGKARMSSGSARNTVHDDDDDNDDDEDDRNNNNSKISPKSNAARRRAPERPKQPQEQMHQSMESLASTLHGSAGTLDELTGSLHSTHSAAPTTPRRTRPVSLERSLNRSFSNSNRAPIDAEESSVGWSMANPEQVNRWKSKLAKPQSTSTAAQILADAGDTTTIPMPQQMQHASSTSATIRSLTPEPQRRRNSFNVALTTSTASSIMSIGGTTAGPESSFDYDYDDDEYWFTDDNTDSLDSQSRSRSNRNKMKNGIKSSVSSDDSDDVIGPLKNLLRTTSAPSATVPPAADSTKRQVLKASKAQSMLSGASKKSLSSAGSSGGSFDDDEEDEDEDDTILLHTGSSTTNSNDGASHGNNSSSSLGMKRPSGGTKKDEGATRGGATTSHHEARVHGRRSAKEEGLRHTDHRDNSTTRKARRPSMNNTSDVAATADGRHGRTRTLERNVPRTRSRSLSDLQNAVRKGRRPSEAISSSKRPSQKQISDKSADPKMPRRKESRGEAVKRGVSKGRKEDPSSAGRSSNKETADRGRSRKGAGMDGSAHDPLQQSAPGTQQRRASSKSPKPPARLAPTDRRRGVARTRSRSLTDLQNPRRSRRPSSRANLTGTKDALKESTAGDGKKTRDRKDEGSQKKTGSNSSLKVDKTIISDKSSLGSDKSSVSSKATSSSVAKPKVKSKIKPGARRSKADVNSIPEKQSLEQQEEPPSDKRPNLARHRSNSLSDLRNHARRASRRSESGSTKNSNKDPLDVQDEELDIVRFRTRIEALKTDLLEMNAPDPNQPFSMRGEAVKPSQPLTSEEAIVDYLKKVKERDLAVQKFLKEKSFDLVQENTRLTEKLEKTQQYFAELEDIHNAEVMKHEALLKNVPVFQKVIEAHETKLARRSRYIDYERQTTLFYESKMQSIVRNFQSKCDDEKLVKTLEEMAGMGSTTAGGRKSTGSKEASSPKRRGGSSKSPKRQQTR